MQLIFFLTSLVITAVIGRWDLIAIFLFVWAILIGFNGAGGNG